MYIFSRTLVETVKLLCLSVACSAIFSMMIFQDDVASIAFVCFILNLVSLLLFLILSIKNWQNVFSKSFTPTEYWIPAIISYSLYLLVSTFMYVAASSPEVFSNLIDTPEKLQTVRQFFRYCFQQTRFLEPMLNSEYSFVSFALSQALLLVAILYVPKLVRDKT